VSLRVAARRDQRVTTGGTSTPFTPAPQACDLGLRVRSVARGGGLELSPGPCCTVMASPDLSREHGVDGEIFGRSCRPVPGGYGAFVITV
jgi:hypothetical protein